jgi:hypothetical protein
MIPVQKYAYHNGVLRSRSDHSDLGERLLDRSLYDNYGCLNHGTVQFVPVLILGHFGIFQIRHLLWPTLFGIMFEHNQSQIDVWMCIDVLMVVKRISDNTSYDLAK